MATKQIIPVIELYFHLHIIINRSKPNCKMFISLVGKSLCDPSRHRHLYLFNVLYLLKPDGIQILQPA